MNFEKTQSFLNGLFYFVFFCQKKKKIEANDED